MPSPPYVAEKSVARRPSGPHGRAAGRLLGAAASCFVLACGSYMREGSPPRGIPHATAHRPLPSVEGAPHDPQPMGAPVVPPHPYMAPNGASCMHVDAYTSNAYSWSGPLGHAPEVDSRSMGFLGGECPTINFDSQGRIVTVCVRDRRPSLLLLDPDTLAVLARHGLPRRRTPLFRVRKMMEDTSGGAYFYLDHKDRAVLGTADDTIEVIDVVDGAQGPAFVAVKSIDLGPSMRKDGHSDDRITAVLPDYEGNYWFATRRGQVGLVTRAGAVEARRFDGEEIQNAFSVAPDGTYVVTDHALYRLERKPGQPPTVAWREAYDRGSQRKVGQINQGSGTTPTLLGDDLVAIADNAEPRMNVLVFRRNGGSERRLVCKTSVFQAGQSATENTLIGYQRSLVVENNAGYDIFRTMRRGRTSAPGIARIDVREDLSGCDLVWESDEISQTTVPKLSTSAGLVYLYTKRPDLPGGMDAYYFTAIDFNTGRTVYRVLTGTGVRYDNNWGAISLAPDGSAYVGVLNGLVRVRDRELSPEAGASERPESSSTL